MSVEIAGDLLAGFIIFGILIAVATPIVSVVLSRWKPKVKIDIPVLITTKIS